MKYGRRYLTILAIILLFGGNVFAQTDAPNDINAAYSSGTATAIGKWASTPINLYTGIPNISIPVYKYSYHNGLNLDISLDYFAGGVRTNELPTPAGLNWFLNAGGAIVRTVRGMPDDLYPSGSMYSANLPSDPSVNAYKYYHDSIDAQLDVFQFNFNGRSGKFYIGKNRKIRVVPFSKLKISFDTTYTGIDVFRIVTEDGVNYVFRDKENQSVYNGDFKCGYNNVTFTTGWYLSQIIAPFGTDTIKFIYNVLSNETNSVAFPQTVYVDNSNINNKKNFSPVGQTWGKIIKLASIIFPDKKNINFQYSILQKYDGVDSALNTINIGDSIFRYGYVLDWAATGRSLLTGIRSYTPSSVSPKYKFTYSDSLLPAIGTPGDPEANKKDHWGYFNGAPNGSNSIPTIQYKYTGANRDPSSIYAISSTLNSVTDPSGGITYYKFESNDLPKYTLTPSGVYIDALTNTQNTISLNQVFGNLYTFFIVDDAILVGGNLTGSCGFTCSITSLDGTIIYKTFTTSLYQLAAGVEFSFNAPNGSFLLKTTTSSCSANFSPLGVDIIWQNQTIVGDTMTSGGIRLKQLSHFDPTTGRIDTIATYNYRNPDGKSSGFLGAVPIYTYPYSQTVINGSTIKTNYTAICSDPINDLNFTQGSPVGYAHVEVIKGTSTHNLGKTAYDFRTLSDVNANLISPFFPYAPISQRDWLLGLLKRQVVYDSSGRIISIRQNTYLDSIVSDTNANFRSRKLGKVSTTYNGNPSLPATPYTEYYNNFDYFPETGNSLLTRTIDSFYHSDNSLQIVKEDISYDSNFNITKVSQPYDLTRGLILEKRYYYPYNYTISSGTIKKLRDSSILNTIVSTENWIVGDANPRMLNAEITDFQQLSKGHIKPLNIYRLQSNSPINQSTIGLFDPTVLIRNTVFFVLQENYPFYDSIGNALEIKNPVSGQSNSIIMDYYNQLPIATVTNSSFSNIAYTSFESDGNGGWTVPSLIRNYSTSLTGKLSYDLANGSISKSGLNASFSYIISVWVKSGASVNVNGSALSGAIATQNGWSLYTRTLTGITTLTISGSGQIDELRLYPSNGNMQTKTYEPMIGITSTCDANNTVNYYSYDFANRIKLIKDKDLNVLKEYEYDTSIHYVNTKPNWQFVAGKKCELPLNNYMDTLMKDNNVNSFTYNYTKWFLSHMDCINCHTPCNTEGYKSINCVCELGTLQYTSSTRVLVNGVYKWQCTYMYCWDDGTHSNSYVLQYSATPCTVQPICIY